MQPSPTHPWTIVPVPKSTKVSVLGISNLRPVALQAHECVDAGQRARSGAGSPRIRRRRVFLGYRAGRLSTRAQAPSARRCRVDRGRSVHRHAPPIAEPASPPADAQLESKGRERREQGEVGCPSTRPLEQWADERLLRQSPRQCALRHSRDRDPRGGPLAPSSRGRSTDLKRRCDSFPNTPAAWCPGPIARRSGTTAESADQQHGPILTPETHEYDPPKVIVGYDPWPVRACQPGRSRTVARMVSTPENDGWNEARDSDRTWMVCSAPRASAAIPGPLSAR